MCIPTSLEIDIGVLARTSPCHADKCINLLVAWIDMHIRICTPHSPVPISPSSLYARAVVICTDDRPSQQFGGIICPCIQSADTWAHEIHGHVPYIDTYIER